MRKRHILIVGTIIITTLFVILFSLKSMRFQMISVSPKDTLPTSTDTITMKFNRKLASADKQSQNFVSLEPSIPHEVSIIDDTISIRLRSQLENNIKLTIDINILSDTNEKISKKIGLLSKYIPFDKLSNDERDKQIQESSIDGDSNPLLSKLPVDNISYRVNYILDNNRQSKQISNKDFIITVETFVPKEYYSIPEYQTKTQDLRNEAKNWIKENTGVDPNTISIQYIPSDEELQGVSEIGD